MKRIAPILLLFLFLLGPGMACAQESGITTFAKARVTSIGKETTVLAPGTSEYAPTQELTVLVLNGPEKGQTVSLLNDYTQLTTGQVFYLRHIHNPNEAVEDFYSVADPYRLDVLIMLGLGFLALVFLFGGLPGVRGLATLAGSLVLIFYLLLPGIIHGYPPVFVAIGVSSLIIVLGSYLTHGFNRTTTAAVVGMLGTVIVTGLLAAYVVHIAQLSGYNSEDSAFLHFEYKGTLDLVGILLGGVLIGLLGVLYDSAIGQAVAVEELMSAGQHLVKREIYRKALRIGREHIGALVNTLAIAYVGAALPLLLLFRSADAPLAYILNGEIFATEIIRILIGSIGLVLAVPFTTFIAVEILSRSRSSGRGTSSSRHSH